MYHPFYYSGFKERSEQFVAAQQEKTIWRKVCAAAPIILLMGIAIAWRVAISMENFTFIGKVGCAAIITVLFEVVSLSLVVASALMGRLNDWIKPPDPDGKKRISLIVYLLLVPALAIVTLVMACFLVVVMMQPHPWNFLKSSFS